MKLYEPGQCYDAELLAWYTRLVADGDLEKLVGPSLWPLGAFLEHFRSCPMLYYDADSDGWWFASWAFPFMGGGTWGVWFREDRRGKVVSGRQGMRHIRASLEAAFAQYPVLVNVTKQPVVVPKTEKLGYTYLGSIPHLFEGETAHVLALSRENFEAADARWSRY